MNEILIEYFADRMGEAGYAPTDPIERRKFIIAASEIFSEIVKDHHTEATNKYIGVVDQLNEVSRRLGGYETREETYRKNIKELSNKIKKDRGHLYDATDILAKLFGSEPPNRNYSKALKLMRYLKNTDPIT